MASGDSASASAQPPKHLTYSKSNVPIVGALIDYMDTNLDYIRSKSRTFLWAEKLYAKEFASTKTSRATLSPSFMATVCLILGLVANVKLEVVTFSDEPLVDDLHFMLLSKENNIYVNDIDASKVMLYLEASDIVLVMISSSLIRYSSRARSPLTEYLYLPWMGATLRGLFIRQGPTAVALVYTMTVVDGSISPLFLTAFLFLFLLEARIWLEITRIVRSRWELRERNLTETGVEVETLWSNDDVQSMERATISKNVKYYQQDKKNYDIVLNVFVFGY